jgi:hypothetical protein
MTERNGESMIHEKTENILFWLNLEICGPLHQMRLTHGYYAEKYLRLRNFLINT